MPLYLTYAKAGAIDEGAKQKIAADITDIHCRVTDAPPAFVHAFFIEDGAAAPSDGKSAKLVGTIRAGRTPEQKDEIRTAVQNSFKDHAALGPGDIEVEIHDTPASWVMEGGHIMPEPGEEAEWFAAHGRAG